MSKDKKAVVADLRDEESIKFDSGRYGYLINQKGLNWRTAAALILAEAGYSHSGIANFLDVADSTAKGYLSELSDDFGEDCIESHPKSAPNDNLWMDGYNNPYN